MTIRKNRVLIIAAHPDDETIGCGGAIAKHRNNHDSVSCIYFTNGVGARFAKNFNEKEVFLREKSSIKAEKILGFKWLHNLCQNFPDNSLDNFSLLKIIKTIEKAKRLIKPNLIYTHSSADLNIDHRRICEAVMVAFRPQPGETWEEIRLFEVPSSTEYSNNLFKQNFKPNLFINIQQTWKKKSAALRAYQKEMKKYPHPRSLNGNKILAQYRGIQNGLKMAEAFEVVKKIVR